jgi:hypothetical protein
MIGLIMMLFFPACKKEGGKHCPVIIVPQVQGTHAADLSQVAFIPQIMDTLAKYPQLHAIKVNFGYGFDPGSYFANVHCNVYYRGLKVLSDYYTIYYSSYDNKTRVFGVIRDTIPVSPAPVLSAEEAGEIAEKEIHFEHCRIYELGYSNYGAGNKPDYKLIWKVMGAERSYPQVELDAATGQIYRTDNGIVF